MVNLLYYSHSCLTTTPSNNMVYCTIMHAIATDHMTVPFFESHQEQNTYFRDLRSLWMIFLECRYCIPDAICLAQATT